MGKLTPNDQNPRTITEAALTRLKHTMQKYGDLSGVVWNRRTGHIVGGHQRVKAMPDNLEEAMKIEEVWERPTKQGTVARGVLIIEGERWNYREVDWDIETEKAATIAANKNAGEWDKPKLAEWLLELESKGWASEDSGYSLEEFKDLTDGWKEGEPEEEEKPKSRVLEEKFLVPPFSVLDGRQGYWQDRKREWLLFGIQSELGRGANLLGMSETMLEPDPKKRADAKALHINDWVKNKKASGDLNSGQLNTETAGNGTSVFDPVLCELAYLWFSPLGGKILDPFAGGSVRGIVASKLQRSYLGFDLRAAQIKANEEQAAKICDHYRPAYLCSSSEKVLDHVAQESVDFVFSCPPYGDLERYSDDPEDLSTMAWNDFLQAYRDIIGKSVAALKPNRFAAFVVGDIREKNAEGFYRNFIAETIEAFQRVGAAFYNEAILIQPIGTLSLRAGRTFSASRKLGKTHQNLLVFCKGNPKKATEACGEIEINGELFSQAVGVAEDL